MAAIRHRSVSANRLASITCPVRPIGCRSHGSRRRRRHLRRGDPFTIRTVTGACTMKNFGIRDALFGTVAVVALYGAVPAGAGQVSAGTEAVAALTDAENKVDRTSTRLNSSH